MRSFFALSTFSLILFTLTSNAVSYRNAFRKYTQFNLSGAVGPESIDFDCNGKGPYVAVSDGRVLRWDGHWREFSIASKNRDRSLCDGTSNPNLESKCGRPLGIKFSRVTCQLFIADATFGLQVVGPNGGAAVTLSDSANGVPYRFTNGVDVDCATGDVYFTDSSEVYSRKNIIDALSTGDATGRLMKYNLRTKKVTVLWEKLAVANGVALSRNRSFLLVAETGNMRILKFSLPREAKGPQPEVFAQLARYPDNIKRVGRGQFWIGMNSGRVVKNSVRRHVGEAYVAKSTGTMLNINWFNVDPVAVKVGEDGKVLKVLDGEFNKVFEAVSEVMQHRGELWVGSYLKPYLARITS